MRAATLVLACMLVVACRGQRKAPEKASPEKAPEKAQEPAAHLLVTLPQEPLSLAMDDSFLYWTESGGGLFRLPKSGGSPLLVTSVDQGVDAAFGKLVVDRTNVYVIETGERDASDRILAVPKAGGTVRVLAKLRRYPSSIAVDNDFVYWVDDGPIDEENNGGLQVMKAPKSGGASVTIVKADRAAPDVTDISLDDRTIFWVDNEGLFTASKSGGKPKLLWHGEEDIDGQSQFWGGEHLESAGDYLFVVSAIATIERVPKGGGAPVLLVDQPPDGGDASIAGLATDGSKIYWTTDVSGGNSSVRRAGHDGKGAIALASQLARPGSVLVDATQVYWIDVSRHSIMSIPK